MENTLTDNYYNFKYQSNQSHLFNLNTYIPIEEFKHSLT